MGGERTNKLLLVPVEEAGALWFWGLERSLGWGLIWKSWTCRLELKPYEG